MEIKYKLGDVAKQLNVSNKKVATFWQSWVRIVQKHIHAFGRKKEMNYVMDRSDGQNSEKNGGYI